jgi:class 3 adenylate cyclase/tetratricopeptide (TPR) repeat protein
VVTPQSLAERTGQVAHGERRQITIMFCDLVGSTSLSERMDPEVLSRLISQYYGVCRQIIAAGGGFVARLVGDGILAYFGYPEAPENGAESAIRTSLWIVDRLASERFEGGGRLAVHIGLATGVTVISDIVGPGFAERHTVTGLTPNLAARIQAVATAGSVLVADETRQLAGGFFTYADVGAHRFRGLNKPVRVWRVTGQSLSSLRFEAHHAQVFTFVGREAELATLVESWNAAQRGEGRIVTLRGEAGIGKSRLLRAAAEQFARRSALVALLQCSPHQASAPLHPVIDWIRREVRIVGSDSAQHFERLAAWLGDTATALEVALVAELVGVPVPDAGELRAMLPDRKRILTRELLVRHFERHCGHGPVLFMLEDAHWMDGATEEFLRALFAAMRQRAFLGLITARPPEQRDWSGVASVAAIRLEPLPPADAEKLIHHASRGSRLAPRLVHLILARTDGVPLFIEELTATVVEAGLAHGEVGLPALAPGLPLPDIPSTLRDSLTARLDRLQSAKEIARIASALGREFTLPLLQRVTGEARETLTAALDRLIAAQLLMRREGSPEPEYVFKHALVQQAAYEGQLRSDREALHGRIVEAIEGHQPDLAAREPGLMVYHCHEANLSEKEVDYLHAAGRASTRLVAIPQALAYFSRAREVVAALPPTPQNVRRHIDIILGLMEVGRFAILPKRLMELGALARELSRREGVHCDAATLSSILFQEARALLYSTHYTEARRIFTELRQLGREQESTLIAMRPGSALTMNLCCQGLFNESLAFVNEGNIDYYRETGSIIDYIAGLGWLGYASCQAGPGDAGLRFADLSVHEAAQLQSPIYVGGARIWRSHALMAARRLPEAIREAERCIEVSETDSVPYLGWHGLVFLALCLCRASRFDDALAALAQARGLLARVADGQWSLLDYLPAIEAEIACFRGDPDWAVALADQAIAGAQAAGGCFAEAMAWRAKAVSSLRVSGDADAAQALFDHSAQLHEHGGARAEQAFCALVWAHALQRAGHAERARRWAAVATDQARAHGFALARCEYGASAML